VTRPPRQEGGCPNVCRQPSLPAQCTCLGRWEGHVTTTFSSSSQMLQVVLLFTLIPNSLALLQGDM